MFIWLTNPTIGQVLVNLNLVTAVTCVQGRNTVSVRTHRRKWKPTFFTK